MFKYLVFTDAHNASKNSYKNLLDKAISERVKSIFFLGDIDTRKSYQDFFDFMNYSSSCGMSIESLLGNHDQAWLDYALKKESKCVATGSEDESMIGDNGVIRHIQGLPKSLIVDDILFHHAFPHGKRYSGQQENRNFRGDHRFKYRDLWHSSFGTNNSHKNSRNNYDGQVLGWNFNHLLDNALNYLIKGHEHTSKVWHLDSYGNIQYNSKLSLNSREKLSAPSIVQLAAFRSGNYAILEKNLKGELFVENKRLRRDEM